MYKELPNGLMITSLTDEYREKLPEFYVDVYTEFDPDDVILGDWARDLISGKHPAMTDDDVWMVIDPAQGGRIAAALLLIRQTWYYAGIPVQCGRVELVATGADYRNRGLIRALMQVAHERCDEFGCQIQAITGIRGYYRQFGYTMTLELGTGGIIPFSAIPKQDNPPYRLRLATDADIPDLIAWRDHFAAENLVTVERSAAQWAYELHDRVRGTIPSLNIFIIEPTEGGRGLGYISVQDIHAEGNLNCLEYCMGPESSYLETFSSVLVGLHRIGAAYYAEDSLNLLSFDVGVHEAVKTMLQYTWGGYRRSRPYSWYIRVPSLAGLLQEITPVLEQRLTQSAARHYTGELKITFYDKTGLTLKFTDGKLSAITDDPPPLHKEHAGFPFHSFLSVVFGHHTVDELRQTMPDVYVTGKAAVLLEALFPKQRSWLMGVL